MRQSSWAAFLFRPDVLGNDFRKVVWILNVRGSHCDQSAEHDESQYADRSTERVTIIEFDRDRGK